MKYLIVGLGNIGVEYADTRHNIGFRVVDYLAQQAGVQFIDRRYGATCEVKIKGRTLVLLKPSTYMNLSGNAVRYWMTKENIPIERMLIIVDDLALAIGCLRIKPRGSDAGHNGLKHIQQILGSDTYPRLRFGIGNEYPKGGQIDFVLGSFTSDEELIIIKKIESAAEMTYSFVLAGIQNTMNQFNNK